VDWDEDEYVSRRDLVKFVVLTSAAFVVGQAWAVWKTVARRGGVAHEALPIATVDELPIGGAKTFDFPRGSTPRLLVKTAAREFVAYDQQCTHLQCPVVPVVEQGKLHCPCHNGWFDLATGNPLSGPPRRRLPRIVLKVSEGTVFATDVEDST
jgi:Rieske Fe-S protein